MDSSKSRTGTEMMLCLFSPGYPRFHSSFITILAISKLFQLLSWKGWCQFLRKSSGIIFKGMQKMAIKKSCSIGS